MNSRSGLVLIHCAVLLFGLAGLFGKTIALSSLQITWGRTLFAALSLGAAIRFAAHSFHVKRKHISVFIIMGCLLAAHWWTFFHAIQISTVAIGLLSFAGFPIVVILLEPFFDEVPFHFSNLLYAFLTLIGVFLVLPEISWDSNLTMGGVWGLLSGALYGFVTLINRRFISQYSALTIGFWQYLIACTALSFGLLQGAGDWGSEELVELVILGVVFTALAHGLFIQGMKTVSATTASLIGTLEPVYGVTAAAVVLSEFPSMRTILGGAVVMLVVARISTRDR